MSGLTIFVRFLGNEIMRNIRGSLGGGGGGAGESSVMKGFVIFILR